LKEESAESAFWKTKPAAGIDGALGRPWENLANTLSLSSDLLLFVVCGGLIFEALRLIFGFFG